MNSINIINGNIITLDKESPKVHSLSINKGRISLINDINEPVNNSLLSINTNLCKYAC